LESRREETDSDEEDQAEDDDDDDRTLVCSRKFGIKKGRNRCRSGGSS
jgi:hypothetical protein